MESTYRGSAGQGDRGASRVVGRMALRAFELDTVEIPKAGFGRISGPNP